jgi:ribonuclease P protein component
MASRDGDSAGPFSLSFGKSRRVVSSRQFAKILRSGTFFADDVLVLCARVSESVSGPSRLGITIPKKAGCAVLRNRWKRLIRESFRTQQHNLPRGFDFVVRPKKDAIPRWQAIERSIPRLARRAAQRLGPQSLPPNTI